MCLMDIFKTSFLANLAMNRYKNIMDIFPQIKNVS